MAEEGGRFSYVPLTEVSVKTGEFQADLWIGRLDVSIAKPLDR